jgi:hypothetical protein
VTYYLTVLSQNEKCIPASEIQQWLDFGIINPCGDNEDWIEMYVCTSKEEDSEIAQVHKYSVEDGNDAIGILDQLVETLDELMPKSAHPWINEKIRSTKIVYSFLILNVGALSAEAEANRWQILNKVCFGMLKTLGGILHEEDIGFLNSDGRYVAVDPEIGESGEIEVAILQEDTWKNFSLDLSNYKHKKTFLKGGIPVT